MKRNTKVVISLGCNLFSVELAFNLLQRKVFADSKLDLYILTSDTDVVKEMAAYIKTFGFSNMNGTVINRVLHVHNIYIYVIYCIFFGTLTFSNIHRLTINKLFPISYVNFLLKINTNSSSNLVLKPNLNLMPRLV